MKITDNDNKVNNWVFKGYLPSQKKQTSGAASGFSRRTSTLLSSGGCFVFIRNKQKEFKEENTTHMKCLKSKKFVLEGKGTMSDVGRQAEHTTRTLQQMISIGGFGSKNSLSWVSWVSDSSHWLVVKFAVMQWPNRIARGVLKKPIYTFSLAFFWWFVLLSLAMMGQFGFFMFFLRFWLWQIRDYIVQVWHIGFAAWTGRRRCFFCLISPKGVQVQQEDMGGKSIQNLMKLAHNILTPRLKCSTY